MVISSLFSWFLDIFSCGHLALSPPKMYSCNGSIPFCLCNCLLLYVRSFPDDNFLHPLHFHFYEFQFLRFFITSTLTSLSIGLVLNFGQIVQDRQDLPFMVSTNTRRLSYLTQNHVFRGPRSLDQVMSQTEYVNALR